MAEVTEKMKIERKVVIYARVSTNSAQRPEMQIWELREYCKNRGWKIAGEFIDSGISGGTDSRPQLNRLMADAHRR
jgi:DNA invertase Pin-like site-specific DNA recombinase